MNRHLLSTISVYLLILLLAGCSSLYHDNTLIRQKTEEAELLLINDKPEQAIHVIKQLGDKQAKLQDPQRLLVAEALLKTDDFDNAKKQLELINPTQLSLAQLNLFKLFSGQLQLREGEYRPALEQFLFIIPEQLNQRHRRSYYQSLAFAYSLNGQFIESARTRINLSELLTQPEQEQKNHQAILKTLSQVSTTELSKLEQDNNDKLRGWASLARLVKSNRIGTSRFKTAFNHWQQRYPIHPGHAVNFKDYQGTSSQSIQQPGSIAVLLPESGPYAQVALTIKAGLQAAESSSSQTSLSFYNSNIKDIQGLYKEIVNGGAELVIGPLQKKNIALLAQLPELRTPVLALNRVNEIAKDNLFQFGLNPEDEAEQIAYKAFKDGHRRVLILVPNTPLGKRIANSIKNTWHGAGGSVVDIQTYNPKHNDFSAPIQQLLRSKSGVDAIFISGRPKEARSLNPQLIFYGATYIPIYATPQIYTGIPNPAHDFDLNNITFCDSPWLFNQSYQGQLSIQNQTENWQRIPSSYIRLFAMGIDSYKIIPFLSTMTNKHYPGATGNLMLNENNHIKRQLACAKFQDGLAQPLSGSRF